MLTLRLTQNTESQTDQYCVEVTLQGADIDHTAVTNFHFLLAEKDQENIRWYLEDFLQYSQDPAPAIAKSIEKRMEEVGIELFEKVFHSKDYTRRIWEKVRPHINETRIEVVTGTTEAAAIPWELIRDTQGHTPLALRVAAFVRNSLQGLQHPQQIPRSSDGKIRILVVICRPQGNKDIPFRSVATKLIKGLTESGSQSFQLDILRPPNFTNLARVLRQATDAGQPYDIVHFDGHGGYEKISQESHNKRGYLEFEGSHEKPVHGHKLGKLLAENNVRLLVINACRSAYVEVPTEPNKNLIDNQANAYGSLAQEVIDAGVTGVVAMRYNTYVFTAAQFVSNLYTALAQGQTLGEAVTQGRKQLYVEPIAKFADQPQKIEDWVVPIVYEAAPTALFPKFAEIPEQPFKISQSHATPVLGMLDPQMPQAPEVGFFGRDETLLELDRAFDNYNIVLLHAYAGSGKTSVTAEFGRWYAQTGGVNGWVLFTTFERYIPLMRVLDKIGEIFGDWLKARGIDWLVLNDNEQQDKVLEVLKELPVLWIWDNVELVAGFPEGTDSPWSLAEQRKLVEFLQKTRNTKAKFLLTSRRDEYEWLGELPVRITMPPMSVPERLHFAQAIATNKKIDSSKQQWQNWLPLLQFTQGNPLTVKVLVNQALYQKLETKEQIEEFVARLRVGEEVLEKDDIREEKSQSLHASLSYGFTNAFNEEELQQLALLYLFQGFVDEMVFCWMGDLKDNSVPALCNLTSEAAITLLKRAVDVGLLTDEGNGFFSIHPALPLYFKKLFDKYYTVDISVTIRAFIIATSRLAAGYSLFYMRGYHHKTFDRLSDEEANLLYALHLARIYGYWNELTGIIQALDTLYNYTGRRLEWSRLVNEVLPDFIDLQTKQPLPGREDTWYFVTNYYARLKRESREWSEAEQWYRAQVKWLRLRVARVLAKSPKTYTTVENHSVNPIKSFLNTISRVFFYDTSQLDTEQCNILSWLATALSSLGDIQQAQNKPSCVDSYEQAILICQRLILHPSQADQKSRMRFPTETAMVALNATNLGSAYIDVPKIYNLDKAEKWLKLSLELREPEDFIGRGCCLTQLGCVEYERFRKGEAKNQPKEHLQKYLKQAENLCCQALQLFPFNELKQREATSNLLGLIYVAGNNLNEALAAYRESIRCAEARENLYGAAQTCYNVALALGRDRRFDEALLYAQTALRHYQTYGNKAANDIKKTQGLIAKIQQDLNAEGG